MGQIYIASFEDVTVSAQVDNFEILPATQRPCVIHAVHLSQNTDTKDAGEFMVRTQIIRGHTTSGSGGTTPTKVASDPSFASSSATVEANNTTIASAGTGVIIWSESWNCRVGFLYLPTPEMRPIVRNAETIVVRLAAAPDSAIDMAGTLVWEEL